MGSGDSPARLLVPALGEQGKDVGVHLPRVDVERFPGFRARAEDRRASLRRRRPALDGGVADEHDRPRGAVDLLSAHSEAGPARKHDVQTVYRTGASRQHVPWHEMPQMPMFGNPFELLARNAADGPMLDQTVDQL